MWNESQKENSSVYQTAAYSRIQEFVLDSVLA